MTARVHQRRRSFTARITEQKRAAIVATRKATGFGETFNSLTEAALLSTLQSTDGRPLNGRKIMTCMRG